MKGSVVKFSGRHESYEWCGEKQCWVNSDGKPVKREKEHELRERAEEVFQRQMMDRLELARASFHCMASIQERKAAFEWLRQAYQL